MGIFLVLVVAMSIRIGIMDSYIKNRRKFIGEESINIIVYTLYTAFYMSLALDKMEVSKNYLMIIPMLFIISIYILFMYFSCRSISIRGERAKKRTWFRRLEYIAIIILSFLFPLVMIYPLIDIAMMFLYEFEQYKGVKKFKF